MDKTALQPSESTDGKDAAMTAVTQRRYGSSDVFNIETIPMPEIGDQQVLIEVHAAGVDRGVWHLMTGLPYLVRLAGYGLTKPKNPVPGMDVSGRVVATGDSVTRVAVGDEVFGIASGAYAQYVAADEAKLSHKPENVSFESAAVAAISGITALQALTEVAGVEAGQSVLVIGASGGVGSYAVQIARALGADVTGVASAAKADVVRDLGAEFIAYDGGEAGSSYLDGSRRFDVIVDAGGRNPTRRLRRALAPRGTLVFVGGEDGNRFTGGVGRQMRAAAMSPFIKQRLAMFISQESHRWIDRLADLMSSAAVVPVLDRTYALDETPRAVDDLASGRLKGKAAIVVRPRG
ncbi:MAG: NAD(P)-dependent alcohol dehydrogenase [Acidimicrobiales bacterium]|nr:NAD(P)-dependent alcohol dehydrogenase [Acidimicrobiales bacterium]